MPRDFSSSNIDCAATVDTTKTLTHTPVIARKNSSSSGRSSERAIPAVIATQRSELPISERLMSNFSITMLPSGRQSSITR